MRTTRSVIAFLLSVVIFLTTARISASAASDAESLGYGFSVDRDTYKKALWYNTVTTKCYLDGYVIGICTTNIGMTRAKECTSDGKYMDQVMVRCTMAGRKPVVKYCGYSEHLTIQSKLPKNTSLMSYSPTELATSTSYTVGMDAGTGGVGVSASAVITKNALVINSYSDTSSGLFKACYDYQHNPRWGWSINNYSYRESIQYANYVIKTSNNARYWTSLTIKSKFERWNNTPCYGAYGYGEYAYVEQPIAVFAPK